MKIYNKNVRRKSNNNPISKMFILGMKKNNPNNSLTLTYKCLKSKKTKKSNNLKYKQKINKRFI